MICRLEAISGELSGGAFGSIRGINIGDLFNVLTSGNLFERFCDLNFEAANRNCVKARA